MPTHSNSQTKAVPFLEMMRWLVKEFGFAALLLTFALGSLSVGVGIQFYKDMGQIPATMIMTDAASEDQVLPVMPQVDPLTGEVLEEKLIETEATEMPLTETTAVDTNFLRYELYSRGFWFLAGGLVLFSVAGILAYLGMTRRKSGRHNLSMGLA